MTTEEKAKWYDSIPQEMRDYIYGAERFKHVKLDVESFLDENYRLRLEFPTDLYEYFYTNIPDRVASRWVFDGRYDCDISYWDNIHNLIDDELRGSEEIKMVVDAILDRYDGYRYNAKEFYNIMMLYHSDGNEYATQIASAIDGGENEDVQRALCKYITECNYNPLICVFINAADWLHDEEDRAWEEEINIMADSPDEA